MQFKSRLLLWGQRRIEKGAFFLAPFSFVWGLVSYVKNFLYDVKFFSVFRVKIPVISIGNIVAGGTGKTPLVLFLASFFSERKIAILSRGYGKIADEPLLLQRRLKNAKVYVGKDRVALAKIAEQDGCEIIFLDDGFQYRKLYRDLDLVILSGKDPFGKGHFLPWGFLRDSPKRLANASLLFVNGQCLKKIKFPYIQLHVQVDKILSIQGEEIACVKNEDVACFCGIAKPQDFFQTVETLGAKIVDRWILFDHDVPTNELLHSFIHRAKQNGATKILCTEKDIVKISSSTQFDLPIYYLQISFLCESEEKKLENLFAKINQTLDNPTPV